jgi:hypothetical protein
MGIIFTAAIGIILAVLFMGFYAAIADSIALILIVLVTVGCMVGGFVLDYRQEQRLATTR